MAKLSSKTLRQLFEDSIKDSATFKRLDDGVRNPGHIMFNGVEIFVYIKNLSPAYFDNPDVWRAQMTGIDVLKDIKESSAMFILLGYDSENKVYATWNPHQVKQRIGTASSPSLYSRLSLQKEVSRSHEIKSMVLNNDLEVLVFPYDRLIDVLSNLDQFFPDTSDYVAMGSKRRSEANAAYKELTSLRRLDEYAKFLFSAGLASSEVERLCQAVKRIVNSNLISLHRKIFLAYDSLSEYQQAVVEFFNLDDVNEFKEQRGEIYPAALSSYIGFLQNQQGDITEDVQSKEKNEEDDDAVREDSNNQQTDVFTDWEATYEDEQGKLTKIMNPELLKKLRPHLDTEYPSLPPAYNIITDFYGDRYPNMQLKDWGRLINAIEWDKCNEDGVIPEEIISSGKKNRQKIKVQFPDGHISNHSKVMQTLVDVVMYADPEKVRDLNIIVCGDNLVTLNLNPIYMSAYKEVGKGLYVNTASDIKRKYFQILAINDRLKLRLTVEIN